MSIGIRTLGRSDLGWFVELHNQAFADSPMPVSLDEPTLAVYLDETDVVPELSHVAWADGEPVSFCLGGLRGRRGSVRGEGTLPSYRRRGLGARVLEETVSALGAAGAREVGLEVIGENAPALPLYERHGFRRRRRLLGWTLTPRGRRGRRRLETVAGEWAVERLAEWSGRRGEEAPWQLQPETLVHLPALALDGEAVVVGKRRGSTFWLYAIAVEPSRRRRGRASAALAALGAGLVVVPGLVPEEWTDVHGLMSALGARPERLWQWEMQRTL